MKHSDRTLSFSNDLRLQMRVVFLVLVGNIVLVSICTKFLYANVRVIKTPRNRKVQRPVSSSLTQRLFGERNDTTRNTNEDRLLVPRNKDQNIKEIMATDTDSRAILQIQNKPNISAAYNNKTNLPVNKQLQIEKSERSLGSSHMHGRHIKGTQHIILYNRVPKCGSRTMISLIQSIAVQNGYHMPVEIRHKGQNSATITDIVRQRIQKTPVGTILYGHVNYIDFNQDNRILPYKKPIYINLIRDPIERLVSTYYFVRYGDGKFTNIKRLHKMMGPQLLNETFNDCVHNNRSECVSSYVQNFVVRYFCGYSADCDKPSEIAFEKATRNLDKYVVVGITEDYVGYLNVLEKLLPDFFGGIMKEYMSPAEKVREEKMKSKHKIPPTPEVKERLTALMEFEYRFYNHVKARFQELKRTLKIT